MKSHQRSAAAHTRAVHRRATRRAASHSHRVNSEFSHSALKCSINASTPLNARLNGKFDFSVSTTARVSNGVNPLDKSIAGNSKLLKPSIEPAFKELLLKLFEPEPRLKVWGNRRDAA
jgi:hypothetical protein